ncbi:MAG: extracellular matrix regulator RemB [Eubacteriales bacterium]|jgi:hypothetical protein
MYLHLGGQIVVPFSSIIGIFDLDNATVSKHTRKFLEIAQKDGRVVNVSGELPRSFIVCKKQGSNYVYISQISSQTLLKRVDENSMT